MANLSEESSTHGIGSGESSILFASREKVLPDIIPQWVDSGDGQKLFVPDSDEDTIVARAGSARTMCCNILIFSGEFAIDWSERSAVTRLASKDMVENFCKKAYESNYETVQKVRSM